MAKQAAASWGAAANNAPRGAAHALLSLGRGSQQSIQENGS